MFPEFRADPAAAPLLPQDDLVLVLHVGTPEGQPLRESSLCNGMMFLGSIRLEQGAARAGEVGP